MNSQRTKVYTFNPNNSKSWADYQDDDVLPNIPWAPHIKPVYIKSESNTWTTVQFKKKRK